MRVAALYIDSESIYKEKLPTVQCWDKTRGAENYHGGMPIVAHPPCAQWCKLAHMANHKPTEKQLAIIAVQQVRRHGGVLEHPMHSKLWKAANLPREGGLLTDDYAGYTLQVNQWDYGHVTNKWTWLYICGVPARIVFAMMPPRRKEKAVIKLWRRWAGLKKETGMDRNLLRIATPPPFADFLISIADQCKVRDTVGSRNAPGGIYNLIKSNGGRIPH